MIVSDTTVEIGPRRRKRGKIGIGTRTDREILTGGRPRDNKESQEGEDRLGVDSACPQMVNTRGYSGGCSSELLF